MLFYLPTLHKCVIIHTTTPTLHDNPGVVNMHPSNPTSIHISHTPPNLLDSPRVVNMLGRGFAPKKNCRPLKLPLPPPPPPPWRWGTTMVGVRAMTMEEFPNSMQSPSTMHSGISYPVRANPFLRYIHIYTRT